VLQTNCEDVKIDGRIILADGLEVIGQMEQELRVRVFGRQHVCLMQVIANIFGPPSELIQHAHRVMQRDIFWVGL